MTLAQPIGIYLGLWKSFRPETPVPFPGTNTSYTTLHTDTSQDILGDFTIYISMQGAKTAGLSFNIADNDGVTWESTWNGICSYFGLKGVGPDETVDQVQGEQWIMRLRPQWAEWEQHHGLRQGTVENAPWEFFTIILYVFLLIEMLVLDLTNYMPLRGYYSEVNRNLDLTRTRSMGWNRTYDAVQSYHDSFDRLRDAKMLPRSQTITLS